MCGTGGVWEISVRSFQFCCKPTTVLKNKVLKNEEIFMIYCSVALCD